QRDEGRAVAHRRMPARRAHDEGREVVREIDDLKALLGGLFLADATVFATVAEDGHGRRTAGGLGARGRRRCARCLLTRRLRRSVRSAERRIAGASLLLTTRAEDRQ